LEQTMSAHSTKHRKIRLTASHHTASTATTAATTATATSGATATDDDEDSFTDLIFRNRKKCVRFNLPHFECDDDSSLSMPMSSPVVSPAPSTRTKSSEDLWYSKKEVQMQRHDVQRTIRSLRKHAHCGEGSAHVFLGSSPSPSSCRRPPRTATPSASAREDPTEREGNAPGGIRRVDRKGSGGSDGDGDSSFSSEVESARSAESGSSSDDPDICYRGCERYYSLETRFMAQKVVVDAVLDAQAQSRKWKDGGGEEDHGEEALRRLSEEISQPGRELARWHATLNSFQCYGFAGLLVSDAGGSSAALSYGRAGAGDDSRDPDYRPSAYKPTTKAHTALWWEDAVTAPDCLPRQLFVHGEETGELDGNLLPRRYKSNEAAARTAAPAALTRTQRTPPHRRSNSLPSPPTQYVFAPRQASAVVASSSRLVSPRS
jgi:hypothetical protein